MIVERTETDNEALMRAVEDAVQTSEQIHAVHKLLSVPAFVQTCTEVGHKLVSSLDVDLASVGLILQGKHIAISTVQRTGEVETLQTYPLEYSLCQYVVAAGRPLVIADASTDPLVKQHIAFVEMGVHAYVGDLVDAGTVRGALCVASMTPHQWTDEEQTTVSLMAKQMGAGMRVWV